VVDAPPLPPVVEPPVVDVVVPDVVVPPVVGPLPVVVVPVVVPLVALPAPPAPEPELGRFPPSSEPTAQEKSVTPAANSNANNETDTDFFRLMV
jgi:hypothetical protein